MITYLFLAILLSFTLLVGAGFEGASRGTKGHQRDPTESAGLFLDIYTKNEEVPVLLLTRNRDEI